MNSRRKLILSLGAGVLAVPLGSFAQLQPSNIPRIGFLGSGSAPRDKSRVDAFLSGLRDFGYIEGKNIIIEWRWAESDYERLSKLAAELVQLKVVLIFALGTPAAVVAKRATATIPIVIGFVSDPVGSGLVASLRRPGGNITGWTHLAGLELHAKRLELLKEAIPRVTRIGVLWNPANPVHASAMKTLGTAASALKVELHFTAVKDAKEFESAFSSLTGKHVEALMVQADGLFLAQGDLITSFAARNRIPTMDAVGERAEAGGLMAYGANLPELYRRGAYFVDKILKGTKPADLPVEQPTKFELTINMKTAKALGIKIPNSIVVRADKVIE